MAELNREERGRIREERLEREKAEADVRARFVEDLRSRGTPIPGSDSYFVGDAYGREFDVPPGITLLGLYDKGFTVIHYTDSESDLRPRLHSISGREAADALDPARRKSMDHPQHPVFVTSFISASGRDGIRVLRGVYSSGSLLDADAAVAEASRFGRPGEVVEDRSRFD